jgi:hypothetical protein
VEAKKAELARIRQRIAELEALQTERPDVSQLPATLDTPISELEALAIRGSANGINTGYSLGDYLAKQNAAGEDEDYMNSPAYFGKLMDRRRQIETAFQSGSYSGLPERQQRALEAEYDAIRSKISDMRYGAFLRGQQGGAESLSAPAAAPAPSVSEAPMIDLDALKKIATTKGKTDAIVALQGLGLATGSSEYKKAAAAIDGWVQEANTKKQTAKEDTRYNSQPLTQEKNDWIANSGIRKTNETVRGKYNTIKAALDRYKDNPSGTAYAMAKEFVGAMAGSDFSGLAGRAPGIGTWFRNTFERLSGGASFSEDEAYSIAGQAVAQYNNLVDDYNEIRANAPEAFKKDIEGTFLPGKHLSMPPKKGKMGASQEKSDEGAENSDGWEPL